jgi:hypothetical protein
MFLFILLPVLLVLGMILIAGPALLPAALVAVIVLVVMRMTARHRHPDQTARPR